MVKARQRTQRNADDYKVAVTHPSFAVIKSLETTDRSAAGLEVLYKPPRKKMYTRQIIPWDQIIYVQGDIAGGEARVARSVAVSVAEFIGVVDTENNSGAVVVATDDGAALIPSGRDVSITSVSAIEVDVPPTEVKKKKPKKSAKNW